MNGGKLSLIQQYYTEECPVVGMIDDSPDICYEIESGNLRAYRIFGGRKPWQRHERFQPVFSNFSHAVDAVISDWQDGALPLAPKADEMKVRRGVLQLPGR